ncbi:MAG: alpha/beta hydrolase [Flavobacteriales bacterium]|nr:alpha/beta hydrolase [Flavobacteriales bacterium]MCB9191796.1 alpha/beta hydrolase [Flavobacteriales bacterium]
MKKAAYTALALVITLSLVYMLGPQPAAPTLDPTPISYDVVLSDLDSIISLKESQVANLKPDNEATIFWVNDSVMKTEYSVVYLHGLSASRMEGDPVHYEFAKRYGMNMYLPRLYGHGIETPDALGDLTPENYLQSAKEAIAIGKTIGEKVIIMCCSTGGTLAFYLAAHDPEIEAIIAYSPNIDIYDSNSQVLTMPWGLQIVRLVMGGKNRSYEAPDEFKKYWQTSYRLEGLQTTRLLIDETMTSETFGKITQPVFVGCYYKDEENQDFIVSVQAMRSMMDELGTSESEKVYVEFPDVEAHVITNPLRSKDVESVMEETFRFAEEVVGLNPMAEGNID